MNEFDQVPFAPSEDDFAGNPDQRCPCLFLLDTSASMAGPSIEELNAGVRLFKEELIADINARRRVEVAVVTFGGTVNVLGNFVTADNFDPVSLTASGNTPMGEAINRGLELLDARKKVYKDNHVMYYRPWVFMITDGAPTDDWSEAALRVHSGEENKNFSFFIVAVDNADMKLLAQIAKRTPLKLKGYQYREMFLWLTASLRSVSSSALGDVVSLTNPATPEGWAEI